MTEVFLNKDQSARELELEDRPREVVAPGESVEVPDDVADQLVAQGTWSKQGGEHSVTAHAAVEEASAPGEPAGPSPLEPAPPAGESPIAAQELAPSAAAPADGTPILPTPIIEGGQPAGTEQ